MDAYECISELQYELQLAQEAIAELEVKVLDIEKFQQAMYKTVDALVSKALGLNNE